jgi:abhydrolase domain-containing protein 14
MIYFLRWRRQLKYILPWIEVKAMEQWATIKGLNIRYLMKGNGHSFVLLHGFSFFAETWLEMGLFDELTEKYCVYSFDMPYGVKSKSDKFEAGNRDEYAEFLHEMLKILNIDKPILLGASISGEVTLRYLLLGYEARAGIVAGPANVKSLTPVLERICVPLLAVWGDADDISRPEHAQIVAAHVKNSLVHVIKGAGHACYLDRPGEFKTLVRNFLQTIAK